MGVAIFYNVGVRVEKPCSHIFYIWEVFMFLPSYKLNNSYTVYVNYHYWDECAAGKERARKTEDLAEIKKRVMRVLQSQKNYYVLEKNH